MTGPEHYQAAEKLLDAADVALTAPSGREHASTLIAEAQAHATLALAATNGIYDDDGEIPPADYAAWREVAATKAAG